MRQTLIALGLGVAWFICAALAVELMTNLLSGSTLSGFAFLVIRFGIYSAVGLGGALASFRLAKQLRWPLLIVVLLIVGERLTFHYEIYRLTWFSILNLSIDYIGFAAGVLAAWVFARRQRWGSASARLI